jgi:hypothetical protein
VHAQQQDGAALLRLGAVHIGMDLPELRAALPQAAWTEQQLSKSGVHKKWTVAAALSIVGDLYDLEIERKYGEEYRIWGRRSDPAAGPGECEDLGLNLIAALEPSFGRLQPTVFCPFLKTCFDSETMECARNVQTFRTSSGSEIRRLSQRKGGGMYVPRNLNDRGLGEHMIAGEANIANDDAVRPRQGMSVMAHFAAGACRRTVSVWRLPPFMQPPARVSADKLRFSRQPTIGAKHNAAIQLPGLPAGGQTFEFICAVFYAERGDALCNELHAPATSKEVKGIVTDVADHLQVDLSGFDREAPGMFEFDYDLRLAPADIQPIAPSANPLPLEALKGIAAVGARSLRRERLAQELITTKTVTHGMTFGIGCVVQTDFSFACALPKDSAPPLLVGMILAQASALMAPKTLENGASTVGVSVRMRAKIGVRDEDGGVTFVETR